jgi:hypothetical protein
MTNTSASITIPIIISPRPASIPSSFRFSPSLKPRCDPRVLRRPGGAKVSSYCSTARGSGRAPARDTAQALSQENVEIAHEEPYVEAERGRPLPSPLPDSAGQLCFDRLSAFKLELVNDIASSSQRLLSSEGKRKRLLA